MSLPWSGWLIVIPARLASQRLPRKPLADLGGKPMVMRVYERLLPLQNQGASLLIATDSPEILQVCQTFGATVTLTDPKHQSGTDRCAEVAQKYPHQFILNVQGDEPFIDLQDLEALRSHFVLRDRAAIGTLVFWNEDRESFANPNLVKAIANRQMEAIYFSRAQVPFPRDGKFVGFWHHQGVYAFRKDDLLKFCRLPVGQLEAMEKLEQLRALENGLIIQLVKASRQSQGIDTAEDLEVARAQF